jgi:hypothetical protein
MRDFQSASCYYPPKFCLRVPDVQFSVISNHFGHCSIPFVHTGHRSALLQIFLLAIHLFLCSTRLHIKNEGLLDVKDCKEGYEARTVD